MQDHATRLVGLDGVVVTDVQRAGEQLDLQVELLARAGGCPHCGGERLRVKERPVVRVRDLPIAGRRRGWCGASAATAAAVARAPSPRPHAQLPARQRVTGRFRARLAERVSGGARARRGRARGAHQPLPGRARVRRLAADEHQALRRGPPPRRLSLDEAHHRRGRELATVVSDLDRRCVVEVLDGRDRRTVERWLSRTARRRARRRSRSSRSTPTTPTARRSAPRCRTRGSSAITSTSCAAPTPRWTRSAASANARPRPGAPKGVRRSGQHAAWRPELYRARHRLLKARERLTERERRRLCELFERDPIARRGLGPEGGLPRDLPRRAIAARPSGASSAFLAAVERAGLPAFDAFAKGIRLWRERAARLLRRAHHQRLRRRRHQQGQGHQAPRLRHPHLRRLPPPRAPSMRLNGTTRRHPARSTRTEITTKLGCCRSAGRRADPDRRRSAVGRAGGNAGRGPAAGAGSRAVPRDRHGDRLRWHRLDRLRRLRAAQTVGVIALALILFEGGLTPVLPRSGRCFAQPSASRWSARSHRRNRRLRGSLAVRPLDARRPPAGLDHRRHRRRRDLRRCCEGPRCGGGLPERSRQSPASTTRSQSCSCSGSSSGSSSPTTDFADMVLLFVQQLAIGAAVGCASAGSRSRRFRERRLASPGLYPVASLAAAAVSFGAADSARRLWLPRRLHAGPRARIGRDPGQAHRDHVPPGPGVGRPDRHVPRAGTARRSRASWTRWRSRERCSHSSSCSSRARSPPCSRPRSAASPPRERAPARLGRAARRGPGRARHLPGHRATFRAAASSSTSSSSRCCSRPSCRARRSSHWRAGSA